MIEKIDQFIRNNFLLIVIILAVIFAFSKKATVWQQVEKTKTTVKDNTLMKPNSVKIIK